MYKYKFVINAFGEGGASAGASAGDGAVSQGANSQIANASEVGNESSGEVMDTASSNMSFDDYVKQHKDEASKWFQKQFDSRHRDYKQLKERAKASDGILDVLSTKYGIDRNNIDDIAKAIKADDSMYEEKAMEAGLTVDQYRNLNEIENENRRLRAERQAAEEQQRMDRQVAEWERQSSNLKQIFPSFDLETELQNPDFANALQGGLGIERAYYAVHGAEITSGAMQYTANAVRQATAQDLSARRSRPRENGLSSNAAAKVSKDVHNMTKAERAALAERSKLGTIRI